MNIIYTYKHIYLYKYIYLYIYYIEWYDVWRSFNLTALTTFRSLAHVLYRKQTGISIPSPALRHNEYSEQTIYAWKVEMSPSIYSYNECLITFKKYT